MKRLLFFDIDGTLLPENGEPIPQSACKALALARQNGCLIFINTGRTRVAVPPAVEALAPDGYVCGCGTAIYLGAAQVFYKTLPTARAAALVGALRQAALPCFYESEQCIWFDGDSPARQDPRIVQAATSFRRQSKTLRGAVPAGFTFQKFLAFGQPTRRLATLTEIAGADMEIICREREMAEVTLRPYTKGTGIGWLAAHYGVPLADCYAFGDSTNDLPMLAAAGHSIAMGNAMPDILPLCEYTTADILSDGIAQALAHYHLLGV
ncbi:MAG: HAD family hydrolase [Gemmiger sp.]|nr:HAD family hydrolase [Gemmiger sp.]